MREIKLCIFCIYEISHPFFIFYIVLSVSEYDMKH